MKIKTINHTQLYLLISVFSLLTCVSCVNNEVAGAQTVQVGAERTGEYLPLIKDKRVAIVANHTTMINDVHLVDSLLALDVNVVRIFSPEHGFRGKLDAGKIWDDYTDEKTSLKIVSLYGSNKKPDKEAMEDIDVVIFDIQDVGVRFYTYISTMHYVMEACADNDIEFLVLDRPNPNDFYIDGPVLEKAHTSFVGMHPVPIVHGMTIAEYARMINGEGWLKNRKKCNLQVIKCKNYSHNYYYKIPVSPSPNLNNMQAVYLYPSLGLFEGTVISIGKGTSKAFQFFGHPQLKNSTYKYTPQPANNNLKVLKYEDETCYGKDLNQIPLDTLKKNGMLNLEWIIFAYNNLQHKDDFFNPFFTKLAGTKKLENQIKKGLSAQSIKKSWQKDLNKYKMIRKQYLLYPDFRK